LRDTNPLVAPLSASVGFKPDVLNLKSKGRWVTVYVELPGGYNVNEIDICSIKLNGKIQAQLHPTEVGDYDNDGGKDLMVKFDRETVKSILSAGTQTITITGAVSGMPFQGTDTIKVISP
jgi:rhamnogalacturonan endolyase